MFKIFGRSGRVSAPDATGTTGTTGTTGGAEPMCPDTGLPYGEPGSTERLAWIFAMDDLEDAEERA
ncbi:hypothetical protein [Streptomyces reticuliscabiei]|uniref:hypothetical protein n=1 Tax=Streptomyces reticuliscabiei TaxID=146821 RepID=UPI000A37186C|nr:hypothetical protein [Streptomyces reticuliscabiei]